MVAIDASKGDIAGVILQEYSEDHLKPCAYCARKLIDDEIKYNAYDKEALAI